MYRFHGQIRTAVKHFRLVNVYKTIEKNAFCVNGPFWVKLRYSIKTSNISTFQCSVLGVVATRDLTGNMWNTTVLIFILQKSCKKRKKYS